jgi:hypothetical protein
LSFAYPIAKYNQQPASTKLAFKSERGRRERANAVVVGCWLCFVQDRCFSAIDPKKPR